MWKWKCITRFKVTELNLKPGILILFIIQQPPKSHLVFLLLFLRLLTNIGFKIIIPSLTHLSYLILKSNDILMN